MSPRDQLWQPINTAPKDGTPFLVYFRNHVELVAGWREYSEIIAFGEPPSTHWHPIPQPPPAIPPPGAEEAEK
jgi:hypothetical protein